METEKAKPRQFKAGWLILFLVGPLVIIGLIAEATSKSDEPLHAGVSFNGRLFTITNNDAVNWTNCRLEVNDGDYELKEPLLEARETHEFGAREFVASSGTRFDPKVTKLQAFTITCETPRGQMGKRRAW